MSILELLTGTLDGVLGVDRQQRIVLWNRAAQGILGFDPDSVVGRPCHAILSGLDASGCRICEKRCAIFRASLRGELSPTRKVQVNTKDRNRIWIDVTTFVLRSRWHELVVLAHVFRDASEVEKTEAPLPQELKPEPAGVHARTGPAGSLQPLEPLTQRETEVLRMLASGASTDLIGTRFNISAATVRTHVQHILAKLAVHSRLEAVASATRHGLLRPASD